MCDASKCFLHHICPLCSCEATDSSLLFIYFFPKPYSCLPNNDLHNKSFNLTLIWDYIWAGYNIRGRVGGQLCLCVLLPIREDGEHITSTCLLSCTDNLFSCPLWPLPERFFILAWGGDERQSAPAWFGVDWAGPVSLPGRARPSQAVPAPQRASVQRGTGGQDAWPRISYHSEFCSCHWHLARGNNGRDNSCRYRPIHLFMPLCECCFKLPYYIHFSDLLFFLAEQSRTVNYPKQMLWISVRQPD